MSRISDIADKPTPDLIWNYDRETGSGPLHISDKDCKVDGSRKELTRCGRPMYPDFHSWNLDLKGRSVTDRRLCKRCGTPEDFQSALEQRQAWSAEWQAQQKAATEAAAREREQAEGEKRERLLSFARYFQIPGELSADKIEVPYGGYKYRIEEVAAHREE